MQSATKDKTWEKITEQIENAEVLLGKKKKLLERIRKAEEEKATVPTKIYEKVRDEYEREIRELDKDLSPLEKSAREAREEIEAEIMELDTIISATKDQITEIEFRQRVGEYDGATTDSRAKPLREQLSKLSTRKEKLLKTFEKFDVLFDNFRDLDNINANPPRDDVVESREAPQETDEMSTIDRQESLGEPADVETGVNPEEEMDDAAKNEDSGEKEFVIEDPLAELADPSFDDSFDSSLDKRAHEQERASRDDKGKGTPMLRILKGANKDKMIPILPITMSIGREHDNNIELKDEEVSRYHARIIHDNGKYVLETLENTTGTWLNGRKITRSALKDSDVIRIGQTELRFEWK